MICKMCGRDFTQHANQQKDFCQQACAGLYKQRVARDLRKHENAFGRFRRELRATLRRLRWLIAHRMAQRGRI